MTIQIEPAEEPVEKVRVPNPEDMDLYIFCKHVNYRHGHSLPEGFELSPERMSPYVAECWRRWHERMHRDPSFIGDGFYTAEDSLDHTHKEAGE
jgi:hypothetical protein